MGHATAVAASLAAQKVIRSEGLLKNVVERGKAIKKQLRKSFASHPHVGDVRGRGMFIGVEFVSNRETREPFDPASKVHNKVQLEAMGMGLLCYGMGGTIDGRRGDHILLAPPYNLDDAEQQELVETFVAAVTVSLPA
jgi:adenosylmethionine-8-amino-7-oxononanoate aminotransferase